MTIACNTVRTAPLRFQQQTLGAATLKLRRLSQLHHQRESAVKRHHGVTLRLRESVPGRQCRRWKCRRRRLSGVAPSVTDTDMAASGALTHWVKILPFKIRPPQENHPAVTDSVTTSPATDDWHSEMPPLTETLSRTNRWLSFLGPSQTIVKQPFPRSRPQQPPHTLWRKPGLTCRKPVLGVFTGTPQWLPLRDQGLLTARSLSG